MRKSERDALLERAKKLRRRKQQRAGFTDFMAMSESPLVKEAKERLDGRAGAKVTKGRLNLLTPKAAKADTKVAPPTPKRQSKDKSDPRGNQIKATPGTAKKKEPTKKFNVGVSKGGVSFKEAFKHYRGLGQASFTWNGKKYTTDVKKAKPKAKISTPTPADFTAAGPKKPAPKKKTTTKSNDPRKNFSSKATPGSNLPAGALRRLGSKGYNSKKERIKKVGDITYVFKKGK